MKKLLAILSVFIMVTALAACSDDKNKPLGSNGMFTSAQTYEAGQSIQGINLKKLEVKDNSIELSFVSGSQSMGINESNISGVPAFSISNTATPRRMIIKIENLKYWDFEAYAPKDGAQFIKGIFKQLPQEDNFTYLYVQLDGNYEFKPVIADGKLTIQFAQKEADTAQKYYVTMDAFALYSEKKLPQDLAMYPVLCSDSASVLLISAPFDTEADAQNALNAAAAKISGVANPERLKVEQIKGNALPVYDESVNLKLLQSMKIAKTGDQELTCPIFFADARFICWNGDATKALFAKPASTDDEGTTDELWLADKDGVKEKITDNTVSSIVSAEFSPSGRYIALAQQNDSMMILSIFDTQTKKLINTSEEGFGVYCTGFAWNKSADILYASVGEGTFEIRSYTMSDGKKETLAEAYMGSVQVAGGKIAYISAVSGSTRLTLYDIASKQIQHVAAVFGFAVSPDGSHALLESLGSDGDFGSDLKLLKLGDDKVVTLAESADVIKYFWSKDSTKLYYLLNEDDQSRYNMALYVYDVSSGNKTKLTNIVQGSVNVSNAENELLITVMYQKTDNYYPATYILSLAQ